MAFPPGNRAPANAGVAALLTTGILGLHLQSIHGVAPARLALQGAALLAGAALALGLATARPRPRFAMAAGGLALVALAATLPSEGLGGVHRWIALGGFRIQPSPFACPLILAVAAAPASPGRPVLPVWGMIGMAIAQPLHTAQPDAGQATALAAGATALALSRGRPVLAALAAATAVPAWLRFDPLEPVPTVEGIVRLAASQGAAIQAVAVLLLVALPLTFFRPALVEGRRDAHAIALGAYVAGAVAAPLLGAFPVPVLGFGVSPVLGVALAIGLAARRTLATP